MYDRLLLPTDSSKGIDRAIDHAIDATERYDADLHILFVIDTAVYQTYSGDEYVHELEGLETGLEQAGREAMNDIAEQAAAAGITAETTIRHGIPEEEILAYIEDNDVGLTVLGSKHRSGEYRRLLGSVAERVVRICERPVTIVKTPVDA